MSIFRRRDSQVNQNPLPELVSLLNEFGPFFAIDRELLIGASSFSLSGTEGCRLRLTPSQDLVFAHSTEGVIVGFLEFGQDMAHDMRVERVADMLNSDARVTDNSTNLLMLLAGLRQKDAEEMDGGFGNTTLQRVSLQAMAKSSMGLAQAIGRGETGVDLETASNVWSTLFPTVPVTGPITGAHEITHRAYIVLSLAHIGWLNELQNDSSAWMVRHWITPSLRVEFREVASGFEWVAQTISGEGEAMVITDIPEACRSLTASNLESALSIFIQYVLPRLRELPWQAVAGESFEELATISLDIEERRLLTIVGLLQAGASDEEFHRLGESSYEEWQGQ